MLYLTLDSYLFVKPHIRTVHDPNVFKLLCWWSYVFFRQTRSAESLEVILSAPQRSLSKLSSQHRLQLNKHWPVNWVNEVNHSLNPTNTFIYSSNSQALTNKTLDQFSHIYLQPNSLPNVLPTDFYLQTAGGSLWIAELRNVLNEVFPGQWLNELDDLEASIKPSSLSVSVISSIYNGDEFLTGFLNNASSWDNYESCEHFLIRAGSSGNEHDTLIKYINEHPNAVYINLAKDPGLYEVWNLGVRLSTAPYLTNANIDDRRAPYQVSTLVNYLDQQPDISLVSAKSRVTKTPNLTWEDSKNLPVMFLYEPEGNYQVDRLFRHENDQVVSRSLPSCMPVWRRDLHIQAGFFDEKRYGPSADWEFWLRAGVLNKKYTLLDKVMGVYLNHEQSYWHREPSTNFDQKIIGEYFPLVKSNTLRQRIQYPLSQRTNEVLEAYKNKNSLLVLSGLIDCILRIRTLEPVNQINILLIDKIAQKTLNFKEFYQFTNKPEIFHSMETPLENALALAIQLLHESFRSNAPWITVVKQALMDYYLLTRSATGLVALAFLESKLKNKDSESFILEYANKHFSQADYDNALIKIYRQKSI